MQEKGKTKKKTKKQNPNKTTTITYLYVFCPSCLVCRIEQQLYFLLNELLTYLFRNYKDKTHTHNTHTHQAKKGKEVKINDSLKTCAYIMPPPFSTRRPRPYWIIADMDGTLTPTPSKAHGHYLSLSEAAATQAKEGRTYFSCLAPLRALIARGCHLCVVSTAGQRMWRQLFADLAPALYPSPSASPPCPPGRLLLCGFTGAALFASRPHQASMSASPPPPPPLTAAEAMVEDMEYRRSAAPDGGPTVMSPQAVDVAQSEGRAALLRFLEHASTLARHSDADALRAFFSGCLSGKYHGPFTALVTSAWAELRAADPEAKTIMERAAAAGEGECVPVSFEAVSLLSMERLGAYGAYLADTEDALVDVQRIPSATGNSAAGGDGGGEGLSDVAQITVLGIPMRFFDLVFPSEDDDGGGGAGQGCRCSAAAAARAPGARARLAAVGLVLKPQPNSVCIHRVGIDKATCVAWLAAHPTRYATDGNAGEGFSLTRAVALGDVPVSVDRPLTLFYPPMPFISLSPLPGDGLPPPPPSAAGDDNDKKDDVDDYAATRRSLTHVGGEEEGSAVFFTELLAAMDRAAGEGEEALSEECVRQCAVAACQRLQERNKATQQHQQVQQCSSAL